MNEPPPNTLGKPKSTLAFLVPDLVRQRLVNSQNLRKTLDNFGWLFFDKILRMGLGLILGILTARYLGAEQFGQLSYAIAFVAIFQAIAPMGLDNIAIRDISKNGNKDYEILGTILVIRICVTALIYPALLLISLLNDTQNKNTLILIFIIGSSVLFQPADTIDLWFQSQLNSKQSALIKIIVCLISSAIKIFLIETNQSIVILSSTLLLESILTAIGFIYFYKSHKTLEKWKFSGARVKKLFADGMPFFVSGLLLTLYLQIDKIILEKIVGLSEVAIFTVGQNITQAFNFLPLIVCASLAPKMAMIHEKKTRDDFFVQLISLMGWSSLILSVLLYFSSDFLINHLYGDQYSESINVMKVMSIAIIPVFLSVAHDYYVLQLNKSHITLIKTIFGLSTNISLNIILIPTYGAYGAAIASMLAHLLANTILYWLILPGYFTMTFKAIIFPFYYLSGALKQNE